MERKEINMLGKETGERLTYLCTAYWAKDEYGRKRKAYRFNVFDMSDGRAHLAMIVNDICSSDEEAHELENLFRRNRVSLNHVLDVLEDWVVAKH
jgi:hypothetical protein